MTDETQAYEALRLAQINQDRGAMSSSAKLVLKDAEELIGKGDFVLARAAAVRSLKYSVGILHPDYARANAGL